MFNVIIVPQLRAGGGHFFMDSVQIGYRMLTSTVWGNLGRIWFWTLHLISGHCRRDRKILKLPYESRNILFLNDAVFFVVWLHCRSYHELPELTFDTLEDINVYSKDYVVNLNIWRTNICFTVAVKLPRAGPGPFKLAMPLRIIVVFKNLNFLNLYI